MAERMEYVFMVAQSAYLTRRICGQIDLWIMSRDGHYPFTGPTASTVGDEKLYAQKHRLNDDRHGYQISVSLRTDPEQLVFVANHYVDVSEPRLCRPGKWVDHLNTLAMGIIERYHEHWKSVARSEEYSEAERFEPVDDSGLFDK